MVDNRTGTLPCSACCSICNREAVFNSFHSSKAIWNNVAAVAVVGILALTRWSMHQTGWSWVNRILGIWVVLSPFVLFLSGAAMWNNIILGIIVAAFALTDTYSKISVET